MPVSGKTRVESLTAVAQTSNGHMSPSAPPLEIDGDAFFDAQLDFGGEDEDDPCFGDEEAYMKADHRGGSLENRKAKIKAMRERILRDKSFKGEGARQEGSGADRDWLRVVWCSFASWQSQTWLGPLPRPTIPLSFGSCSYCFRAPALADPPRRV